MRSAYRGLNYLIAALVLVQAAAIAYAIAGVGHWIDEGNELTKAIKDDHDSGITGGAGFAIHAISGFHLIPLIVLIALIVAFFSKIPGATKRSAILLGLVVVQVFLGIFSDSLPAAITLHALNAFLIFSLAALAAHRLRGPATQKTVSAPAHASV